MTAFRRLGLVPIAVLAVFSLAWMLWGNLGYVQPDETWFLQVVRRVLAGDKLYRDVAYGTTPLAVYAAEPLVAVFGAELLVVRGLYALLFAATALVALGLARKASPAAGGGAGLALALCVFAHPSGLLPPYNALAYLFLLASCATYVEWRERGTPGWLLLAGISAGLAFSAKHTIGAYAGSALAAALILTGVRQPGLGRRLALVALSFTAAVALVLAPSLADVRELAPAALDKRIYLSLAAIPYSRGLRELGGMLAALPGMPLRSASRIYWQLIFLIPPAALVGFAVALTRTGKRERAAGSAVGLFAAAGLLGLYPLADEHHLLAAMPLVLVALHFAWSRLWPGKARGLCETGAVIFLVAGWAYLVLAPALLARAGQLRFSSVPHLRGILVRTSQDLEIERNTRMLAAAAGRYGPRILLVSPYAGLYYLSAGLRNPARQDYPLSVTFRAGEEDQVGQMAPMFDGVCLDRIYLREPYFDRLRPARLEEAVRRGLRRGEEAGFCTMYAAGQ